MEQFNAICFGEVLWDVLPSGARPGGAPMNVAYHLQTLGMAATVISRIGSDKRGNDLIALLQKQAIDTNYIQLDVDHQTGIVNAVLKENNEVEYDIVYPVAWDFISMENEYLSLINKADYFVFGSLAARNQVSKNTLLQLIEAANKKILDINLRPPHFDRDTVTSLLEKADLLKLNEHELELIAGWFNSHSDINDQVNDIRERFDVETILVTRGEKGALVNHQGLFYEHIGFKVDVDNTIGSGDAFLAGYLLKLSKNSTQEAALKFANALGAFVATHSGACPQYDVAKVHEMSAQT